MCGAYCLDLLNLRRWTSNTGCASLTSIQFVNTQFALQWLHCGAMFADTMCTWAAQPCVHTFFYPNNFHMFVQTRGSQCSAVAQQYIQTHSLSLSSRCTLFHGPECLHSLWFNGHFVGCNSILSHPLVPTGEITGSGLIHKTQRTTLESLLQFELSNHNGRIRLPFFPWCRCVYVWVNVYKAGR